MNEISALAALSLWKWLPGKSKQYYNTCPGLSAGVFVYDLFIPGIFHRSPPGCGVVQLDSNNARRMMRIMGLF
jgi:hypothetical protein